MPVRPKACLSFYGQPTRRHNDRPRPLGTVSLGQRIGASSRKRQSGAAVIESTLSILLLWWVATAVVEYSYWGVVRHLCRQALHDSLRSSVSAHGTLQSLEHAFEKLRHSRLTQAWSLRIIHPDAETLSDFQDPFLSAQQGRPVIRNDSQREQHQRFLTRWPDGKGPVSGKTIFEANILTVELTYHHQLLSPWFRHWLGTATTRLSLQAAMQSDIHGGPTIKSESTGATLFESMVHHDDQKHRYPNKPHNSSASGSGTHMPIQGQDRLLTIDKIKPSLTPPETGKPIRTSPNTSNSSLPLHPDLAEQCGTLMCCSNPQ